MIISFVDQASGNGLNPAYFQTVVHASDDQLEPEFFFKVVKQLDPASIGSHRIKSFVYMQDYPDVMVALEAPFTVTIEQKLVE